MSTLPAGARVREFGHESVPPDLLGLCLGLRPLPRALVDLDRHAPAELATISRELLVEAASAGRPDCIYAFCRLNAESLRALVAARIAAAAVPIAVDPVVAEVLAEVADEVRFVSPARVGALYRSIPELAEQVIASSTEEIVGFVPTCDAAPIESRVTAVVAEKVEVPHALLAGLPAVVDAATTQIVAAQAVLQLSPHDRSLLLEHPSEPAPTGRASRSVAELLSARAARQRFLDEFDRISRWLLRALDGRRQSEGEHTA